MHGSVLVQNGVAYFAAGRSSHLDGGLRVTAWTAATGELRCQTLLAGPSYTVENLKENFRPPMGVLPDILMGDGDKIYMRANHLGQRPAACDRQAVAAGAKAASWTTATSSGRRGRSARARTTAG